MQIENHKEEVPFGIYEERFKGLDPVEAASRTGAAWDGTEFTVKLLGREFAISHPEYAIRATSVKMLRVCTILTAHGSTKAKTP